MNEERSELYMVNAFLGILVFLGGAFFLSPAKKDIDFLKIGRLLGVQIVLMLSFQYIAFFQKIFLCFAKGIQFLNTAMLEGSQFLFGYLGGGDMPFLIQGTGSTFIFIFQALPIIVLISALSMLSFHWKILPILVKGISFVARKTFRMGGPAGTAMAAKFFLSQTDVPILIRPYLSFISKNELFSIMTAGMASAALAVFPLYSFFLKDLVGDQVFHHILSATFFNTFSAFIISELMVPSARKTTEGLEISSPPFANTMDALVKGTLDGWSVMWSVGAMMMISVSLVFLAENIFSGFTSLVFAAEISLKTLVGYLFAPLVWLMGVPFDQALEGGKLLGLRTLLNEIVAMAELKKGILTISSTYLPVLIYPLACFANFSAVGIQIALFSNLVPDRKSEVIQMGLKALFAATLSGCLSGALFSLIGGACV
jgi:concentrative nucleoside transporter, CNT family